MPSSTGGGGQTVAVVDAYDDPNIESDLAVYRDQYWLPSCTTANGCFRKVNQNGLTAPLPAGNYGWAAEESLDVEMVSAACPNCHILLVEANSSGPDLYTAVKTAVNVQIRTRDSAGSALTYRATGLPIGLAITATSGSISGTSTTTGTSSVTVSAADASGASASTVFSWTITAGATPPVVTVTNPGARTSVVGTAASLQIKAVGSIASTLTYKATSLPGGLTINPGTGLISGTPTVTGSYSPTMAVSDLTGASGSVTFTWSIKRLGAAEHDDGRLSAECEQLCRHPAYAQDPGQRLAGAGDELPSGQPAARPQAQRKYGCHHRVPRRRTGCYPRGST